MRRSSRRKRSKSPSRFRPRIETLETRLLLACDMRKLDDGMLQIDGDDMPQIVDIEDQGGGEVSVRCLDRGDDQTDLQIFSGVTGIKADLKGGDDLFHYTSVQAVNAALPMLEVLLGEGNDEANVEVTMNGTPDRPRGFGFVTMGDAGDDSLMTRITTLTGSDDATQPVMHGQMDGGSGRDDMTLISSTATGGFTLTNNELTPSGEPTASQPGCLIWDLVDGTSGVVNARVMGSEVDELIELRIDERGIGRSEFDFVMDGGGGEMNSVQVFLIVGDWSADERTRNLTIRNAAEKRLEVGGVVELVATSSGRPTQEWDDGWWQLDFVDHGRTTAATFDVVGSTGRDDIDVKVGDNRLSSLAIEIDTKDGDDVAGVGIPSVVIDIAHSESRVDRPRNRFDERLLSGQDLSVEVTGGSALDFAFATPVAAFDFRGLSSERTRSDKSHFVFDWQGTAADVPNHSLEATAKGFNRSVELSLAVLDEAAATIPEVIEGQGVSLRVDTFDNQSGLEEGTIHLSQRPDGTVLKLENVKLSGAMEVNAAGFHRFSRKISGMHINDGGSYQETIRAGNQRQGRSRGFGFVEMSSADLQIAEGGTFRSLISGGRESDHVVSRLENIVNHGKFVQIVDTGAGADTVSQRLNGFENHGTANFNTRLGAGADSYLAEASGIYVAPDASFAMQVDGKAGRDLILANVQANVDGDFSLVARGGAGADTIGIVLDVRPVVRADRNESPLSDRRPAINVLIEGNDGNDWLGLWLFAADVDDDLLNALVDGGTGWDTARTHGPVRVVNVENHRSAR